MCRRFTRPVAYREFGVPGVHEVAEVVRDRVALRPGRLGGADDHPAIDLHGIREHALAAAGEPPGELHRHGGLPAGGRSEEHEERCPGNRGARGLFVFSGHAVRR